MAGMTGEAKTLGPPAWFKEIGPEDWLLHQPARLDPTQFIDSAAVKITATADAIITDESISVTALLGAIPSGTLLSFGVGKLAKTTAAVAAGAVAIPVEALVAQVDEDDVAYYSKYPAQYIPAGTIVGRTYAERDANTDYGAAVNTDDEIYFIMFDVIDAVNNPDIELVRPGAMIAENHLPASAIAALAASAPLLVKVRAAYRMIVAEA